MTNLEGLRKEVVTAKDEALKDNVMYANKYMISLFNEYYSNYVNNDEWKFQIISKAIDEAIKKLRIYYPDDADNIINYCRVIPLTKILTTLFIRDGMELELPEIPVVNDDTDDVTVNLLERVKLKRNELKELQVSNGYLMGRLLKIDADADMISANVNILDNILSDEAMKIINTYINEDGR